MREPCGKVDPLDGEHGISPFGVVSVRRSAQ
jgi:hypothetical protein